MVTRQAIGTLLQLVESLTYVHHSSVDVKFGLKSTVKGENYILSILQRNLWIVDSLSASFPHLSSMKKSYKQWTLELDKKYAIKEGDNDKPFFLDDEDALKLEKDSSKWLMEINQIYSTNPTVLIKDYNTINEIIPVNLIVGLNKMARQDLRDGVDLLLHGMPTPAAMILFRVAENVIQKYYTRITGNKPGTKTWGQMIRVLSNNPKTNNSLLGYLQFLNDKRIDSAHPYKRYNQEEGERILLKIKDLLEEIKASKRKKRH